MNITEVIAKRVDGIPMLSAVVTQLMSLTHLKHLF